MSVEKDYHDKASQPLSKWQLVSHSEGRIGRATYAKMIVPAIVMVTILQLVDLSGLGLIALFAFPLRILLLGVYVFGTVKRLHDVGKTGWLAVLVFIPIINLMLIAVLCFMPTMAGPNRYGPKPGWRYTKEKK